MDYEEACLRCLAEIMPRLLWYEEKVGIRQGGTVIGTRGRPV